MTMSSRKPNQALIATASMRPFGRGARHDIPAHRHRRVIGLLESYSRRLGQDHRRDVGIASALQDRGIGAG